MSMHATIINTQDNFMDLCITERLNGLLPGESMKYLRLNVACGRSPNLSEITRKKNLVKETLVSILQANPPLPPHRY